MLRPDLCQQPVVHTQGSRRMDRPRLCLFLKLDERAKRRLLEVSSGTFHTRRTEKSPLVAIFRARKVDQNAATSFQARDCGLRQFENAGSPRRFRFVRSPVIASIESVFGVFPP